MNPDFPPCMYRHFLTHHWSHDQILAHQFYNHGKFLSASHLSTQMEKTPIPPDILIAHTLPKISSQKLIVLETTNSLWNALHSKITPKPPYIYHTHYFLQINNPMIVLACKKCHQKQHQKTCWRWHKGWGTLIHIWWTFPHLQTFWKEICHITSHVTSYDLELSPTRFMLHHSTLPHKSYHKS